MAHALNRDRYKKYGIIQTLFCIFLALYPVLCLYKGFYKFTIGDLGLVVFTVLGVLPPPRQDRRLVPVVVFLITTISVFLLNLMVFKTMESWAMTAYLFRLIKLCFYLIAAFTCGKKYFTTHIFERAVIAVGVVATAFMFFQYFAFYGLGRVYLGHIPGLTIYIEEYALSDYESLYKNTFRPCSIFLEPAMYAQFMVVPITLALFSKKLSVISKVLFVSFFSLSVVMSTSAQGLVYLAVIFFLYIFMSSNKKINIILFVCAVFVAILGAYLFLEPFRFAVDRLLYSEDALSARVGTYEYIRNMEIPFKIIGYGYGVVPHGEYMAGLPYVWYGCGIFGVLLVFSMFLSFFRYAESRAARVICAVFVISFFVTSLFYNYMLFWFVALMISLREKRKHRHHHYHSHHYSRDSEYDYERTGEE